MSIEHSELEPLIKSDAGRDFHDAWPLITSHAASVTILDVLRGWAKKNIPSVEASQKCKICLMAFGSLGRLEFVSGQSDLDPLIVIDEQAGFDPNQLRTLILSKMAIDNPWLLFDDRSGVETGKWGSSQISNLRFPVITSKQLAESNDDLLNQRKWQIMLESRPLYGEQMFDEITSSLIPPRTSRSLTAPDYLSLLEEVQTDFFPKFENPKFLHKSHAKYFKTRILRDFFKFSTTLSLMLGWYRSATNEPTIDNHIRASTLTKFIRADKFAAMIDAEAKKSPTNEILFKETILDIMSVSKLNPISLSTYRDCYGSVSAQLVHGLIVGLVRRFTLCLDLLYSPDTTALLDKISPDTAIDAIFPSKITDLDTARVVEMLLDSRNSYLKYTSVAAQVLKVLLLDRHVWYHATTPKPISKALDPFI